MARIEGTKVWTNKVRLSFVKISEPTITQDRSGNDRKKYEVTILIPKSDKETVKYMKKAFAEATEIGKTKHFGGKIPKNLQIKFKDGDEYYDLDKYPENKGCYVLGMSSYTLPGVVDKNRNKITDIDEIAAEIYSGCYARVTFNVEAYNVQTKEGISKGVTAYLQNIQKIADGEPLGAHTPDAEDDFDDWEDDGDEDEEFDI